MSEAFRLKGEERVFLSLRSLYASYGYRPYKMSRFEEYDLYARNKDFLVSGNIITFTDTDGKLMALKPDVTLSIVRSFRPEKGSVSRVCYDENVYRVPGGSGTFREIMQAGLECMGDVSSVELAEVVSLAQKSLGVISDKSVLTISHMGIVEGFIKDLPEAVKQKAISALSARNVPELGSMRLEKLAELAGLTGTNDEIYTRLEKMAADSAGLDELKAIVSVLDQKRVRIDFSVLGGMKYYNGITFRGYVDGVPAAVLSGGQYDKLMARMGKNAKAIGFAVYLDALERFLDKSDEYDVDTVLLYKDDDDAAAVLAEAEKLRKQGVSVIALKTVPANLKYRQAINAGGAR